MQFQYLAALLPFISLALAAPVTDATSTAPKKFILKTVVTSGNKNKGNLYIESYHTGAGLGDAVLTAQSNYTYPAFLNNTSLQFDFGTDYPWALSLAGAANYAFWESVQLNVGTGVQGFYFNDTDGTGRKGLKWNSEYPAPPAKINEFLGWLACDWYHGGPQLFWITYEGSLTSPNGFPDSCSVVELLPETVK